MKTKEELHSLKNEIETLNAKLAELSEEELAQVAGGYSESGTLERILEELSSWLDKNPNATKSEIYKVLNEKTNENAGELTEEELNFLNQLLNSFAS